MVKRDCKEIIIGIYMITNMDGKIYIGQSKDIFNRFHQYFREDYRVMGVKLINSMKLYGSDNHFYEVVEECNINDLDNKEKYYINLYNSKENGLNSTIGGNGLITHSIESKKAIGDALRGRISPLKGRIRAYKGRVSPNKNNKRTQESIKSQIQKMTGKEQKGIKILCTKSNKTWISASQCSRELNVSITTIFNWIKTNKNNLILKQHDN
jgi:group I intron endonuclease